MTGLLRPRGTSSCYVHLPSLPAGTGPGQPSGLQLSLWGQDVAVKRQGSGAETASLAEPEPKLDTRKLKSGPRACLSRESFRDAATHSRSPAGRPADLAAVKAAALGPLPPALGSGITRMAKQKDSGSQFGHFCWERRGGSLRDAAWMSGLQRAVKRAKNGVAWRRACAQAQWL